MKTKIITLMLLAAIAAQAQFGPSKTTSFTVATNITPGSFFIVSRPADTNYNVPATNLFQFINQAQPVIQRGSTNVTALANFKASFTNNFADTNYTAVMIGNGIILTNNYVSAKTVSNCVFNMTTTTGTIDWMVVRP